MKFSLLFRHFKEMKHYFIAAALVFATGCILGFTNSDQFALFIEEQLKGIEGIAEKVRDSQQPQLLLFVLIFFNNLAVALFCIFAGFFFGLFPLFSLLVNGMTLGYIGEAQWVEDRWMIYLKGILPHGILEIPAIVIACAYGIRFGMMIVKGLLTIGSAQRRALFRAEFFRFLRLTVPLCIFLAIVLLLAAIIESTLTLWLLGNNFS